MKTTSIKKVLGSIALLGALTLTPSVFAANASTTASLKINEDGIVHIVNAEITSISGNVIQAITRFKNTMATWIFTTNASTTVTTKHTDTASTTDFQLGDKLNVVGSITSLGSLFNVNVSKIMDKTSFASWRAKTGTVESTNAANGTFILKSGNKLITVQTNASTTYAVESSASSTLTLLGLTGTSKVKVAGTLNDNGTILTATKITVKAATSENKKKESYDSKNKERHDDNGNHTNLRINTKLGIGLGDDNR